MDGAPMDVQTTELDGLEATVQIRKSGASDKRRLLIEALTAPSMQSVIASSCRPQEPPPTRLINPSPC